MLMDVQDLTTTGYRVVQPLFISCNNFVQERLSFMWAMIINFNRETRLQCIHWKD